MTHILYSKYFEVFELFMSWVVICEWTILLSGIFWMNRLKYKFLNEFEWSGLNDLLTTDLVTMDISSLEVQILIELHLKLWSICGNKSSEDFEYSA